MQNQPFKMSRLSSFTSILLSNQLFFLMNGSLLISGIFLAVSMEKGSLADAEYIRKSTRRHYETSDDDGRSGRNSA
jgi:hypothetical protein